MTLDTEETATPALFATSLIPMRLAKSFLLLRVRVGE